MGSLARAARRQGQSANKTRQRLGLLMLAKEVMPGSDGAEAKLRELILQLVDEEKLETLLRESKVVLAKDGQPNSIKTEDLLRLMLLHFRRKHAEAQAQA